MACAGHGIKRPASGWLIPHEIALLFNPASIIGPTANPLRGADHRIQGKFVLTAGAKAPIEHFTRAAAKEFGARGISVTALGPGPMDTPFFCGQESKEAVKYHSTAAALSPFSKKGLTDVGDIVPIVRFLVSNGWWITGQTILVNGGYTTKQAVPLSSGGPEHHGQPGRSSSRAQAAWTAMLTSVT